MSTQHINLLDTMLLAPKTRYSVMQGLTVWVVMLLVLGLSTLILNWAAASDERQTDELHARLPGLRLQVAAPSPGAVAVARHAQELTMLRQRDEALRGLLVIFDGGGAGHTQGYSLYLAALARQAAVGAPHLWLTGFKIDGNGGQLDLIGRMTDPSALPEYLRHLNAEPLFQGRSFAQLQIVPDEAHESISDFALRASVARADAQASVSTSLAAVESAAESTIGANSPTQSPQLRGKP